MPRDLADICQAGARAIAGDEREAITTAAHACGYVVVELGGALSEASLLGLLADELAFPPWFTHDWQGLVDVLADVSWSAVAGHVIVIAGEMADADRAVLAEIVDVAARIRAQAGVALWCLFVTRRPGS